ncbi:MAG TPA: hypothetical protein VE177_00440, partial [Candidatus Binatus sp.]|nr:hypothetical protein [Candidatus Binatus sp.]
VMVSQGDTAKVDMGWRSFAVTDDVKLGNVSLNFVLPNYLSNIIRSLVELPNQQAPIQITRIWTWDGHIVQRASVGQLIQTASLFNFSSLNTSLENWRTSQDPASQITTYQATTGFNLTYAERFVEVGESGTAFSNALYNLRTIIQAPWNTVASGNTLIIESKTTWSQWIMLSLIIASAGIFGSTLFLQRRFNRSTPRKAKK